MLEISYDFLRIQNIFGKFGFWLGVYIVGKVYFHEASVVDIGGSTGLLPTGYTVWEPYGGGRTGIGRRREGLGYGPSPRVLVHASDRPRELAPSGTRDWRGSPCSGHSTETLEYGNRGVPHEGN